MRIRFVTLYYPPEIGAAQRRIADLVTRLARWGHTVTVLTGFPNYPSGKKPDGYRKKIIMRESDGLVTIIRVPHYVAPNKGFFRRLLIHLTFAFFASLYTLVMKRDDIIYLESPPLFNGFIGLTAKWFRRVPYLFNVADLWPQTAVELGLLKSPAVIAISLFLERLFYRCAERILAITGGVRDHILAKGYPADKVPLITNGVDPEIFSDTVAPDAEVLSYRRGGSLLVVYAGTLGLVYALDTLLDAARQVREEAFHFLFIGDGADKDRLMSLAAEGHLSNVTFLPPRGQSDMPAVFRAADLAVIPLRDLPVSRAIMPVKCFEMMAVGVPLILAARGEMAQQVVAAGCGEVIEPEDSTAIVAALHRFRDMAPSERRRIGMRGRTFVIANFSREEMTRRLEAAMNEVIADGR